MGLNNSVERFVLEIQKIGPNESVEFMCHPGFQDNSWDDFNSSADREHELAILCDDSITKALTSSSIRLGSFKSL